MKPTTRRKFLKQTGAGALATAVAPMATGHAAVTISSAVGAKIPAHRALDLPGVHGYADHHSIQAGATLRFHVSNTVPCHLSIHRLGHPGRTPREDIEVKAFPQTSPNSQAIHPGSYIHIPRNLPKPIHALTVECWVRPWNLSQLQGIISQEDKEDERGWALGIGKGGYVGFFLGDGVSPDEAVIHRTQEGVVSKLRWFHIVARWDGRTKEVWVNGKLEGQWPFEGMCDPGPHPLRIGAMGEKGATTRLLDGDIAMPAVYLRALTPEEIQRRFADRGLSPAIGDGVAGCWHLAEEIGDRVADVSGQNRPGRIINHATWMIGGPSFDSSKVPRYGAYDPSKDPERGHGLRLASDDLYDCRWEPTHAWKIPASAKPGVYVARLRYNLDTKAEEYPITFLVRKAPLRRKAPILVLCSTSTWLAYNSAAFAHNLPEGLFLTTEGHDNSHPEAPAYSCYRDHHSGQPSYQFGTRMPWPCAGPDVLYSSRETGYSHLTRAERFLHGWLEDSGYDYDVAGDIDLHRDASLLEGYRTVILNGHSEYWSLDARQNLDRYLRKGGTSIVLSGNTLFWRTTFNQDASIMECRKYDERIGGRHDASIGELFHSHDRRRGSLLRECGLPAWSVIGLECCGWGSVETNDAGLYHVTQASHPLFHAPEETGLKAGDTFGSAPGGKSHKAVGHEYDVRLGRLLSMTPSFPEGMEIPQEPAGITTLAEGKRASHRALDYLTQPTVSPEGIVAEMILWERPQGGRVFHAGAIGAGWALSVDPKFQILMRNVLHAFGIHRPRSRSSNAPRSA